MVESIFSLLACFPLQQGWLNPERRDFIHPISCDMLQHGAKKFADIGTKSIQNTYEEHMKSREHLANDTMDIHLIPDQFISR